ncbi:MAG: hypothetical protein AB7F78_25180 [Hyphomicrobiaceae bacterium]
MRLKRLLAAMIALVTCALVSFEPAAADGIDRKPEGWGRTRHIKHHVYYPRYVHHYKVDPYAWRYSPRGYYPYYNAGYWGSASYVKHRNRLHLNVWTQQPPRFRYYKAWGYPRHDWQHGAWHHKHHSFHHRWHW